MSKSPVSRYPGLDRITDPDTRAVFKAIFDMVGQVQQQIPNIGKVPAPLAAPLNGNNHPLQSIADPVNPQDAVTLRHLQKYVESRITSTLNKTIATIPGAPGGPAPAPAPGETPPPSTGALPVQYTVWMLVQISGVWYTSGFIQMWLGRPG